MRAPRTRLVLLLTGFSIFVLAGCQPIFPAFDAVDRSLSTSSVSSADNAGGFDAFGYNYKARVFVGPADGSDRALDGTVWGDPTYAKDHLVMKWSKAWDDARFHGAAWTPDAWVDNEWNGSVPGGSGASEHCKIVWVGSTQEASPYWRAGGFAIWGEFEVVLDQGRALDGEHTWWAHAEPAGYGTN